MNSIRPDPLASPRSYGEARDRRLPVKGVATAGSPCCVETVSAAAGMDGVLGDRTAGSWSDVNQGSGTGNSDGVHCRQRHEEPCPGADRASIGAKKRGNARGAKGGRDMEAAAPENQTEKTDVVPFGLFASGTRSSGSKGSGGLPLHVSRRTDAALSDNVLMQRSSVGPSPGEPDAGNPPVRFGGRGNGQSRSPYLYL
jgi:hypothetical protein